MPVILNDEYLIPPSMRRRQYAEHDRVFEVSSNASNSTIELSPHRVEYERPLSPLVLHQERIPAEVEIVREREYIIEPARGGPYRHVGRGEFIVEERGRARSAGYDSDSYCSTCDEAEIAYIDDGSTGRRRRRRRAEPGALAAHEDARHGSRTAAFRSGVPLGYRYRATSASPPDVRRRRSHSAFRRIAEAGMGALGGHNSYEQHHERERRYGENHDPHRRARHLAEAGLGIAAAGAAKEIFDARRRRRSSSTSSSEGGPFGRHPGRNVAAAALGATATGLAANQHFQHRRRSQSNGYYSPRSSDEEGHKSHRGRKLAAAAAGVTAAGLAAKAIHNHRARSSSSSASGSDRSHRHRLRNAALGIGTTGLAAHKSRSRSRPGILRRRRSSSTSSNSSTDSSSHKLRNAALLGGAALAAHELRNHYKPRERSPSRHGILRRSSTHSPPRRRSRSHAGQLATAAAATMAGALAERHHRQKKEQRTRSAGGGSPHRRHKGERRHHKHRDHHRHHHHHRHRSEDDSESSTRPRRTGGFGNMVRNAVSSPSSGERDHGVGIRDYVRPRAGSSSPGVRNAMAQEMAHRVGEGVAEGLRRATTSRER